MCEYGFIKKDKTRKFTRFIKRTKNKQHGNTKMNRIMHTSKHKQAVQHYNLEKQKQENQSI